MSRRQNKCVRCGQDPHPGPTRDDYFPYRVSCPRYEPPASVWLRIKVQALAFAGHLFRPVGRG